MKDDIFNPKRRFKSVTELYNYIKKNFTPEKVESAMKNISMPVNVIDPKVHHTILARTLDKIPHDTPKKRTWIALLKARSAIVTQNSLRNISATREQVTDLLASWLGCRAYEVLEEEKKAIEYVKNYLSNNNMGTGAEAAQTQ